jgi:nitrate/nitrite transporter NarK
MVTITVPIFCHSRSAPIVTTFAVTVCFMVWTMFGDIGFPSKRALDLNVTEAALLAEMPELSGSQVGVPPARLGVYAFAALTCLLGVALAFSTAGTSNYISNDYPGIFGAGSGIVGLGGLVVPIMFGAHMELTGVRSSAFMPMCGVVWVSLIWMYCTDARRPELMGQRAPEFQHTG